jgi:hypothetical protein
MNGGYCTGMKLNGVRIQMIRFADDIAIIVQGEINLRRELESVDYILKSNYEMKMKRIKIEFMVFSKVPESIDIKMDDDALKQVPKFK